MPSSNSIVRAFASLEHDLGTVKDNILVPKPPKNCARCTRCGYLVDGPNCQGCALLRQELEENLVTYSPDFQNTSEPSNASTNNSLNDSPSISETSSQSPSNINHCCYECGDSLDGIFCKRCTCKSCGKDAHIGYNCPPNVLVISNSEPCNNQTIDELPQALPIFHPTFQSEAESPFTLDSTPTYVDESPNVFNPPSQPPVYPCEFYGNDAYFGHYCAPQAPFIYPKQCYNQDFNFPQDFQDVPQQYTCCDDCGVTHNAYQCQPLTEIYYHGQNSCYDSNSIGFDQSQPQQYTVNHPIFNAHNDLFISQTMLNEQMTQLKSMCEIFCQSVQKKREEKRIEEEQAAKAKYWKLPVCYDDDDDEERSDSLDDNIILRLPPFSAITPDEPVLSTEDPDNSLSMGDEHLDTIPATESDEFIKSGVETLILIPSETEEGDMLLFEAFLNDDHSFDFKTKSSSTSLNSLLEETNNFHNSLPEFTTFSKVLFDAECESDSSDDQSCFDEDVLEKIVSKPLSEEEIIHMESLRTHDSSLPISSKIDSLLDEFTGELSLLKSIPPGIDESDCDFEEDIRLIEKLLYDNSSPHPPKEFVSVNSDVAIESFSPSPILVKDSDSLMEEIDLFCTPDYLMPPSIVDKDYDSKRDILIPKDLPSNNSLSFAEKESFHFDIPLFSHPPAKPPDGDTGILNIKMMGDIYDQKAFMHKLMFTLAPHQEKSLDLLSHQGLKAFLPFAECSMLIHG
nr:hypothetical protein [Tanacetum cinerariifolium]